MYSRKSMEETIREVESWLRRAKTKRVGGIRKSQLGIMTEDGAKWANRILHHWLFEVGFGLLIVFNLGMVIIETDAVAKDEDPPVWLDVVGWIILISFMVEMALRIHVLQWGFWHDECNVLDFSVVVLDTAMNVTGLIAGQLFPVSFMRIIRLCKLTRLGKALHFFTELRLMMAGLIGSLRAIFWGTVLLVFSLLAWSIVAVQFIHPLNKKISDRGGHGNCDRCHRAYASVSDALLTFCQQVVAGDSWGTVNITVIENYPETIPFFAGVYLSVGMAILSLILGVVVDVASQSRDHLKEEMAKEKMVERMEIHNHLLEICKSLDVDGSGMITRDEILSGYTENENFRKALHEIDVNEEDLEVLWTILDKDRSGTVDYTEFVTNCYNLRSSDTNFILAHVKYDLTLIKNTICKGLQEVKVDVETVLGDERSVGASAISQSLPSSQFRGIKECVEDDDTKSVEKAGLQILDTYFARIDSKCVSWMAGSPRPQIFCQERDDVEHEIMKTPAKLHVEAADKGDRSARNKLQVPDTEMKSARGKQSEKESNGIVGLPYRIDMEPTERRTFLNGSDILQTLNQHHKELTATMQSLNQKLDLMTQNVTMSISQQFVAPVPVEPWSAPRQPIFDHVPSPWGCCKQKANVQVQNVPPIQGPTVLLQPNIPSQSPQPMKNCTSA